MQTETVLFFLDVLGNRLVQAKACQSDEVDEYYIDKENLFQLFSAWNEKYALSKRQFFDKDDVIKDACECARLLKKDVAKHIVNNYDKNDLSSLESFRFSPKAISKSKRFIFSTTFPPPCFKEKLKNITEFSTFEAAFDTFLCEDRETAIFFLARASERAKDYEDTNLKIDFSKEEMTIKREDYYRNQKVSYDKLIKWEKCMKSKVCKLPKLAEVLDFTPFAGADSVSLRFIEGEKEIIVEAFPMTLVKLNKTLNEAVERRRSEVMKFVEQKRKDERKKNREERNCVEDASNVEGEKEG